MPIDVAVLPQSVVSRPWESAPHVAALSWSDPSSRNAIGRDLALTIAEQLRDLAEDPVVQAVVLGVDNEPFCSGWDVRDLRSLDRSSRASLAEYFQSGRFLLGCLEHFPKPVVAVVSGAALGFGCSLLAHADIVIASEDAIFGLPEITHGFMPATVVPELLTVMTPRELTALSLTGLPIAAERAVQSGLVHESLAHDQLDARVTEIVASLARSTPMLLEGTKRFVGEQQTLPLNDRRVNGVATAIDHFATKE